MTLNEFDAAPVGGYSKADDSSFAKFLSTLELPWHTSSSIAEIQKSAFAALIATYDLEAAESGVAHAVAELLSNGLDIEILRADFAGAAGIADLAMLRRFSTLDARLSSGQLETIDITGLSDEELLKLFE